MNKFTKLARNPQKFLTKISELCFVFSRKSTCYSLHFKDGGLSLICSPFCSASAPSSVSSVTVERTHQNPGMFFDAGRCKSATHSSFFKRSLQMWPDSLLIPEFLQFHSTELQWSAQRSVVSFSMQAPRVRSLKPLLPPQRDCPWMQGEGQGGPL